MSNNAIGGFAIPDPEAFGISPEVVERMKNNRRLKAVIDGAFSEALRQVHTSTGLGAFVNDAAALFMDASFHEELQLSAAESMSLRMAVKTVMPALEKMAADSEAKSEAAKQQLNAEHGKAKEP